MSTDLSFSVVSNSSEETEALGERLGSLLNGGEIIELSSDVGGGKTTFTKGIAKGVGSTNVVSSPTFTVNKQYQGTKFMIQHFDFYRLNDPGILKLELEEFIGDPRNIIIIEWASLVEDLLGKDVIKVVFERQASAEDSRIITFFLPPSLQKLKDNL
jgi:tRNA threonylcarbamoyladenosine biosynthesis protein TsaE